MYTFMHDSFLWLVTLQRLMVRNVRTRRKPVERLYGPDRKHAAWRSQKQYSHHLEGAVGCVDEPKFSDVASWDGVDC